MDFVSQLEKKRKEEQKKRIIKYSIIGIAIAVVVALVFVVGATYGSIKARLSMPFVEKTFTLSEGTYYVGADKFPAGVYRLTTPNKGEEAYLFCARKKGKVFSEFVYDKDYVYYDANGIVGDGTLVVAFSEGDKVEIEYNSIVFATYDNLSYFRK